MIDRTEIERLANAAHALRPDWPVKSLCTWLARDHAHRAYRDVAVALSWIATDPQSQTPKRMNELGPWWNATQPAGGYTDVRFERCPEPGHKSYPAHNCGACRSEAVESVRELEPVDSETYTNGAALVRAALEEARKR